ncbi:hypothetical protein ABZ714_19570 [Streptomyces sp. NPDC006798]|uniref:hypothetical protein n=1 Tax=Streptomyces sp. NPDC006798 TaxID=3155462 RepID=UPI0033C135E4
MTCAVCARPIPHQEQHRTACHRCGDRIAALLRELPHQLVLLGASLQRDVRPSADSGAPGRGRAHSPLPLRADVLTLIGPAAPGPVRGHGHDQTGPTPIPALLRSWALALADDLGVPVPPGPATAHAAWLARHHRHLVTRPWIADFHTELLDAVRAARAITLTAPRRHPLPTPCPCGAFGLVRTDWDTYISCQVCGRLLTENEYQRHDRTVMPALARTALHLLAASATAQDPTP